MSRRTSTVVILFAFSTLFIAGCGKKSNTDSSSGSSASDDLLAFMPPDTNSIEFQSLEKTMASPKLKPRIEKEFGGAPKFALFRNAGLTAQDVQQIMEGRDRSGSQTTVVKLKSSADKSKLTAGATEQKAGEKSYWRLNRGEGGVRSIAFPRDNVVLMVSREEDIKSILNRDAKVAIPEALRELVGKVSSGDQWRAHTNSGGPAPIAPDGKESDTSRAQRNTIGSATRIEINNATVVVAQYVLCASSSDATLIVESRKKQMDQQKGKIDQLLSGGKFTPAQKDELRKTIIGAKLSVSGNFVETESTLNLAPFNDTDNIPGLF